MVGKFLLNSSNDPTDWWTDRMTSVEALLSKSDNLVTHAVIPFQFGYDAGGRADVVQFREYVPGVVYATSELIGDDRPMQNALGNYGLAICHRTDEALGAQTIGSLAYYTLDARLEPGQTMDIGRAVPARSTISAFLFGQFGRFTVRGRKAGLLLCIGITSDELTACRWGNCQRVEAGLGSKGVYPFTDFTRRSVLK